MGIDYNLLIEKVNLYPELFKKFLNIIDQDKNSEDFLKDISLDVKKQEENKKLFSEEEVSRLPKKIKSEFRSEGCTARLYVEKRTNKSKLYRIQYRRNGYNVQVASSNLEEAKVKFIEKLKCAKPKIKENEIPRKFSDFTIMFYENFRIKKIKKITYDCDIRRIKRHIFPEIGDKDIAKITSMDCKLILNKIEKQEKWKLLENVRNNLSTIFKGAFQFGVIKNNPMSLIIIPKHERKHGVALSKQEELKLLTSNIDNETKTTFALMLYAGLRPNEVQTAFIDGKFIKAINSKRKNNIVEYKKIPISKMLNKYIYGSDLKIKSINSASKRFKIILPTHKPYDLRTTFYTRCVECGVAESALKEYAGHSLGALGNAYTCLSDEYLLKEGEKYFYELE